MIVVVGSEQMWFPKDLRMSGFVSSVGRSTECTCTDPFRQSQNWVYFDDSHEINRPSETHRTCVNRWRFYSKKPSTVLFLFKWRRCGLDMPLSIPWFDAIRRVFFVVVFLWPESERMTSAHTNCLIATRRWTPRPPLVVQPSTIQWKNEGFLWIQQPKRKKSFVSPPATWGYWVGYR